MNAKPPVVALWLLSRLVGGPSREALLGDLVEQHARGKSNAWFWKETLAAIGASIASETRAHYAGIGAIAFFVGFTSAAALGTVKTLPGFGPVDASLAAFAAGWLVCRFGGLAAGLAFAGLVGVRELPVLYETVMTVLDHVGGLWLVTHYGMAALPASWPWAFVCILAGAVFGARPRGGESAQTTAAP